jgi:catechol 2,3-dioxygenase-like lactoylglutathione lyase family enzyme
VQIGVSSVFQKTELTPIVFELTPIVFRRLAEDWQQRLAAEGVAIESVVKWAGGAQSIYFRDPDQNLAELITPGFWQIV